jgi:probable HAF family extracellular repeat protein
LVPAQSLVLAAVLALAASRTHADPLYSITNLGQHITDGLNNLGDVVGNVGSPIVKYEPVGDPFIYHSYGPAAGTFTDLSGALGARALPRAINDSGQIAVGIDTPEGPRGYLYSGGQLTPIQPPAENGFFTVAAMNNAGDVVGAYGINYYGYLYHNGQTIDLGNHVPSSISNAGFMAGNGFVYQDGKMTNLTNLAPGIFAYASGINDAGQAVGMYRSHAVLYQNGKLTDLGTLGGELSWATAINAQGQVVGYSELTPGLSGRGVDHAFLYQNGSLTDLNRLIPTSANWTLEQALAINDKGQILGYGTGPDGQEDSFLLTPASPPPPIPEPSTLAFFALAAASLACRRAWRRR